MAWYISQEKEFLHKKADSAYYMVPLKSIEYMNAGSRSNLKQKIPENRAAPVHTEKCGGF